MISQYQMGLIVSAILNNEPIPTLTEYGDGGDEHKRRAEALAESLRSAGLIVDTTSQQYQSGMNEYAIDVHSHYNNTNTLGYDIQTRLQRERAAREARVNDYVNQMVASIKRAIGNNPSERNFVIYLNPNAELIELKIAADRIFQNASMTTYEVRSDYVQWAIEKTLQIKNIYTPQFVSAGQMDARAQAMFEAAMSAIQNLLTRYPDPNSDRWSVDYNPSNGGGDHLLSAMRSKGFREGTFGLTHGYIQYQSENKFWVLKNNFPELKAREANQLIINRRESEARAQASIDNFVGGFAAAPAHPLRMSQAAPPQAPAAKDLSYYLGELLKYAKLANTANYEAALNNMFEDPNIVVPENVLTAIMTVRVEDGMPTASDGINCLERLLKSQPRRGFN